MNLQNRFQLLMQIVIHVIATASEAYTSHFTNVTWKVTDKPRFH